MNVLVITGRAVIRHGTHFEQPLNPDMDGGGLADSRDQAMGNRKPALPALAAPYPTLPCPVLVRATAQATPP